MALGAAVVIAAIGGAVIMRQGGGASTAPSAEVTAEVKEAREWITKWKVRSGKLPASALEAPAAAASNDPNPPKTEVEEVQLWIANWKARVGRQ